VGSGSAAFWVFALLLVVIAVVCMGLLYHAGTSILCRGEQIKARRCATVPPSHGISALEDILGPNQGSSLRGCAALLRYEYIVGHRGNKSMVVVARLHRPATEQIRGRRCACAALSRYGCIRRHSGNKSHVILCLFCDLAFIFRCVLVKPQ
jgi:hypothetical protein